MTSTGYGGYRPSGANPGKQVLAAGPRRSRSAASAKKWRGHVRFSKTGALGALFAAAVLGSMSSAFAFSACQVTDTGGIDDKSFNQTA